MTSLVLTHDIRNELIAIANAESPNECCGLLAGDCVKSVGLVRSIIPLINQLASPIAFRSEPYSLLYALRRIDQMKMGLLSIYHSHPSSEPIPSRQDHSEHHYANTASVIIGRVRNQWNLRAWWPDRQWMELILQGDVA